MDQRLLTWGLRPAFAGPAAPATTVRRRRLPRLWLFTDEQRLPDPRSSVVRLPKGRAGVIFRHDGHPARVRIAFEIARICRERRLILVVAGDPRLAAALHAGTHLRGGRRSGRLRAKGMVTSSAHSVPELRRARAAGAGLVFLSPAFPTASHRGADGLGALRWSAMARSGGHRSAPIVGASALIAALGGIDGGTVRRLPRRLVHAVGAIGSLRSE